ncbi:MAG: tripartite tricarboxylate transporter substrate-binding protein, partial [Acetobacterales bacterium]
APAVAALEGEHVDATISSISMGVKLHKEDRVRTLAVLQDKRLPTASDIPGFAESGWTVRASTNRGVQMPAGTPPEIIAMWDAAIAKIHKDPEFLKQAAQRSMALSYIGSAEYTQYIKQEAEAYAEMWAADPWLKK